jgi:GAF domain-containing protein
VLIADDVEKFPGHIACSSASKSEIVLPIIKKDIVVGVLDVDSDTLAHFDAVDELYLQQVIALLAATLP